MKLIHAPLHPGDDRRAGIYVGCAGWNIPASYAAQFPGEGSHLQRYAGRLPAVEINSSFYKPHQRKTYARWRASVPAAFRFSVKMPKQITHMQRLANAGDLLDQFFAETGGLEDKLGPVLVQLPPSLRFDLEVAEDFFGLVREKLSTPVVLEARHPSWTAAAATALLRKADIDFVFADPNPIGLAEPAIRTGQTIYLRLHGSPVMYRSAYTPAYLTALRERLLQYAQAGKTAWCIFDNTAEAAATGNALDLLERLASVSASATRP